MATRVGLLSETQTPEETPAEKVKRSVAECLVKRLLAIQIGKYLFKRLQVNSVRLQAIPQARQSDPDEPSNSPRMGKLKWEPPKHKRQFKAHPWLGVV